MSMRRTGAVAAGLAASLAALSLTGTSELHANPLTVADLLAGAPAADWREPNPDDILYLELPKGRVVIELATRAMPQHAANIKALAACRIGVFK